MTPIRDITNLDPNIKRLEKDSSPQRIARDKAKLSDSIKSGTDSTIKDTVEISSLGRQKSIEQAEIASYAEQLTRDQKLDEATVTAIREKISNGFYSNPEIIDAIAAKLANLPGMTEAAANSGDTDSGRLAEIKEKIAAHVYDSDDVVNEIVNRLYDELSGVK